ncbi:MAG TPA: T9SS type A sorting domain-containing protein, partial [Ignavibacteria bacterium]|nr:T9SS type A sorting domain-containing protein [Ignavibacteria bacterium]
TTLTSLIIVGNKIPEKFSLSQNYPNPFNPVTKIKFDISGTSLAQTFLYVYDVLGHEIAVLVNQQLQPGSYEADWDASAYPSGVYYYKLESGDFTETKKMVLIK